MKSNFVQRALPIIAVAIPATVHAHPGHGAHDLVAGAVHPFLGADHLLAMLAVGLLAAQLGGRSRWAVPAAFVASLAVGAMAGAAGFSLPGVEHAIALSVLILGAIIAFATRLSLPAAAAFAAVCGAFHGLAHGVEMPADSALYGAGFVLASTALHALGMLIATVCISTSRPAWVRCAGAAVAVAFLAA